MSDREPLGPMTSPLADLIDAEHRVDAAPSEVRDRVWLSIVGELPPSGGGPGAGEGLPDAPGALSEQVGQPNGSLFAKVVVVGFLAVGAGTGAWLFGDRGRSDAPSPIVEMISTEMDPRIDAAQKMAEPAEPAEPLAVEAPHEGQASHARSKQPEQRSSAVTTKAAPRALLQEPADMVLERARMSLSRSRFEEAQDLLRDHERRFPNLDAGERELLMIRALLGTSDRKEAETRAQVLRERNPTSSWLPVIDRALGHK